MRKRKTTLTLLFTIVALAACLVACGTGQPSGQEGGTEQPTGQKSDTSARAPISYEAYGFSYPVLGSIVGDDLSDDPEDAMYGYSSDDPADGSDCDWSYSFTVDQLGTGDENNELQIRSKHTKRSLEAVWQEAAFTSFTEALEAYDDGETYSKQEEFEKTSSGKISIGDKECYWYNTYDGSDCFEHICMTLLIPQAEENKYIVIEHNVGLGDTEKKENKEKADTFFKELLNGLRFTDSLDHVIRKDYITIGGVQIPAEGMHPRRFDYATLETSATGNTEYTQVVFLAGNEAKETEQLYNDMAWDETGGLLDDGTIDIDGVTGKWYTTLTTGTGAPEDQEPEGLCMGHDILIPVDEMQTTMDIEYVFDGSVKDRSRYDKLIKQLDAQLHYKKPRIEQKKD
jgi:hypothetical protein